MLLEKGCDFLDASMYSWVGKHTKWIVLISFVFLQERHNLSKHPFTFIAFPCNKLLWLSPSSDLKACEIKPFESLVLEVALSQRCAALLQLGGRICLRQIKREPRLHLCLWPKCNHISLAVSYLNWVISVPKGQHASSPFLQTLCINFYRNRMDRVSKIGFFSLVTQYKPNKCKESSRVIIQTRFHHCWQLLESCDLILLCPWAMRWLFP